jgi:RNA-binding proteins (RRM domain)
MGNRLLVGNLSLEVQESDLEQLFSEAGAVQSVRLVTDNQTGRMKGFACVEMRSVHEAQNAIKLLDGASMDGRQINVNAYGAASKQPSDSFIGKFLKLLRA